MKARLLKRLRRQAQRVRLKIENGYEVDVYVNGTWTREIKREKGSDGLYHNPKISFSLLWECQREYILREVKDMRQKGYDRELRRIVRFWNCANFC